MKQIEVFTDGSATIATKPGGYGFVILADGVKVSEGSGQMLTATNNDAELEAAIQGLASVLKMLSTNEDYAQKGIVPEVTLVSDSEIILGWANGTYRFKQMKKRNKYDQLQFLVKKLRIKTRWVEGHSGNEHNDRCDKLANDARKLLVSEPPKTKKKKKSTNVNLGIEIDFDKMYDMCCKAHEHAEKNPTRDFHTWMTKFVDKMKDQMEVNGEFFSIEVKK